MDNYPPLKALDSSFFTHGQVCEGGFYLKIWHLTLPTACSIQEKTRSRPFLLSCFPLGANMPFNELRHLLWHAQDPRAFSSYPSTWRPGPHLIRELHMLSSPRSLEHLNRKLFNTLSSKYKYRYIKIQVMSLLG
jgi:hypothetical protein